MLLKNFRALQMIHFVCHQVDDPTERCLFDRSSDWTSDTPSCLDHSTVSYTQNNLLR